MERLRKLLLVFAVSLALPASANSSSPYQHFVSQIVAAGGLLSEAQEIETPRGGYLFRFFLDVTGDGSDELFLASSLNANSKFAIWHVYEFGVAEPLDQGLALWPEDIYIDKSGRSATIAALHALDINTLGVFRFEFKSSNRNPRTGSLASLRTTEKYSVLELEEGGWDLTDRSELSKALSLGERVSRPVEKILLSAWLRDNRSSWSQYDKELNPNSQYKDPKDLELIGANRQFVFSENLDGSGGADSDPDTGSSPQPEIVKQVNYIPYLITALVALALFGVYVFRFGGAVF